MTGTYDPELNLLYVGTGNPTPVLNGDARPGDNPGPAASWRSIPTPASWRGAFRRRRTTRTTGTRPKCRCWSTRTFNGAPRKLLLQASRNGYFFVLDRTTGKNLLTTPFAAVNWAKGIDKDGRPIPDPDKEPTRDGRLVAPERGRRHELPLAELRSAHRACSSSARVDAYGIYFFKPEHGAYGWAGADYSVYGQRRRCARSTTRPGKITLEPRHRRRRGRGRRADHRTGLTFTGDTRQRAGASHERRRDAVAFGDRPRGQLADHLRARRPSVRASSAAAARCTRSPFRRHDEDRFPMAL